MSTFFQLLECPSIYELMACLEFKWEHVPLLEIWRQKCDSDGNSTTMLESYPPAEAVPIFKEALSINKVSYESMTVIVDIGVDRDLVDFGLWRYIVCSTPLLIFKLNVNV